MRKKKEGVKRGKEKVEKEENKTESVKIRCEGFVSAEAFENLQSRWRREELRWSFLGGISWRSLRTGQIVNLTLGRMCVWCLM